MKKKLITRAIHYCLKTKTWKIMRLSALLIFMCIVHVFALDSYSQKPGISLDLKEAKVIDVLDEIENSSEYYFLFNQKLIDVDRKVSISIENKPITELLDILFEGTNINYLIKDRQIALSNERPETGTQNPITISGNVTDGSGSSLPGVAVVVKGSTIGTVTDLEGTYTIPNVPGNAVLVFSFVGFATQEIPINDKSQIDVILLESTKDIDEVIVIGYGSQKKVNLTGSISTVNIDNVENRPVTSLSQALSGAAGGVIVNTGSAQPGLDNTEVLIRGINTLNNTTPLVIVDGIQASLSDVNVNDVASISVLKDAASSAIYGSRAANGVILVTTKRANAGQIKVSYNGQMASVRNINNIETVTNSARYMELRNIEFLNSGSPAPYPQDVIDAYKNASPSDWHYANTDWLDYVMGNTGFSQKHDLTIQGGVDAARFRISLGYFDQTGVMPGTKADHYEFRTNFDSKISEKLNVSLNINGKWKSRESAGSVDQLLYGGTAPALRSNPMVIPISPDGRYGGKGTNWDTGFYGNAARILDTQFSGTVTQEFRGKLAFEYEPVKGLVLSGNTAIDYANSNTLSYEKTWDQWFFGYKESDEMTDYSNSLMWLRSANGMQRTITLYGLASYSKTIADNHNFKLMIGTQNEVFQGQSLNGYVNDFLTNDLFVLDAGQSVESQRAGGNTSEDKLWSAFGRLNYNYKEKYLFEVNFRRDGSSRFGNGYKFGNFPSFSAGWRVSEEEFLQDVSFIDNLKIRGSWGQIGNNNVPRFLYLSLYSLGKNYSFDGVVTPGYAVTKAITPNLTWETTEVLDLGFDLSTLNNSLSFTFDYYNKQTKDILLSAPIPDFVGNLDDPIENIGIVENRGFDADIRYSNKIRKVSFSIGANIGFNKNEVITLSNSILGKYTLEEGIPAYSLRGWEVAGIFQTQEEVDAAAFQNNTTGPGDLQYVDQITVDTDGDGVPDATDGVISEDDNVILGDPSPDLVYGANLNLKWNGFDLSAILTGQYGSENWMQGLGIYHASFTDGLSGLINTMWEDAWTPENTDTDVPRLNANRLNQGDNEYWIQNTSFLRIKNVEIGYTVPKSLTHKLGVEKIRVYASGENLHTFTKYEGFDPERKLAGAVSMGYPLHKTFLFGLNVSF